MSSAKTTVLIASQRRKSLPSSRSVTMFVADAPFGRADAPFRRADAPFRRADAPFRRADAPFRRADAPFRRADAPFRRADAPFRRADAPFRRADAPFRRADAPFRRAESCAWAASARPNNTINATIPAKRSIQTGKPYSPKQGVQIDSIVRLTLIVRDCRNGQQGLCLLKTRCSMSPD